MSAFNDLHAAGRVHFAPASDLNAHEAPVATVALPDQVAPDFNGFLNDNLGGHQNTGSLGGPQGNGLDFGVGFGNGGPSGSGLPGGNGAGDSLSGLGVPDGISFGGGLSGLGVPDGISLGGGLSGLGVPDGISFGDGLSGLGVPGDVSGAGSNGGGIFGPGGFQNNPGTDAPGDGLGLGSSHGLGGALSSAWTSLSHGDAGGAVITIGESLISSGSGWIDRGIDNGNPGGVAVGAAIGVAGVIVDGVGGIIAGEQAVVTAGVESGVDTLKKADGEIKDLVPGSDDKAPDQPKPADPKPDNPDTDHHGQGSQPRDDGDSGTGPVHPMTSVNEQPRDDTDGTPRPPGTHLADMPVDDTGTGPVHPMVATGVVAAHADHGASFWDQAAQTIGTTSVAQAGIDLSASNVQNDHAAVNTPGLTASGLSMSELGPGHDLVSDHDGFSGVHDAQLTGAHSDAGSVHATMAAHPIVDLHSGIGTQVAEHAFHM